MSNTLRRAAIAAAVAAFAATSASAAPVSVSNGPVQAHATIVKPLTLVKQSDLNFGSIIVWGAGTATIDTAGNISCTATNLVCGANGTPAEYKVTGTNNQVVTITKPDVTMTNSANPGTDLTLVLNGYGPDDVTLPNSGSTGINFKLGGAISIPANVKDGVYTGDLNVTVNY